MIVLKSGWILLDPDHYWVIREFEVKFRRWRGEGNPPYEGTATGAYEYRMTRNPFPVITRLTRVLNYPKLSVTYESRFDLGETEPPESEFTLSKFGFLEPVGVPPPPRSWTYLWFALVAFAALALAIFFRYRSRRGRTPAPSQQ